MTNATDTEDAGPRDNALVRRRKLESNIAFCIIPLAIVAWMICNAMQRTILLTPVDAGFKRWMAAIGCSIGLLPVVAAARRASAINGRPFYKEGSDAIAWMSILFFFCVFICGTLTTSTAWWFVDARSFADSKAPFEHQLFPLIDYTWGRGGPEVNVDPFDSGDWTELPISKADYQRLQASRRPGHALPLCYPALVQREGPAARIMKPQRPAPDQRILVPCPGI